jgi:hypothetical protein
VCCFFAVIGASVCGGLIVTARKSVSSIGFRSKTAVVGESLSLEPWRGGLVVLSRFPIRERLSRLAEQAGGEFAFQDGAGDAWVMGYRSHSRFPTVMFFHGEVLMYVWVLDRGRILHLKSEAVVAAVPGYGWTYARADSAASLIG